MSSLSELVKIVGDVARPYSEMKYPEVKPVCSSGSDVLDSCIGIGGLPEGLVSMFCGRESSGKSTLALQAIANFQLTEGKLPTDMRRHVALIDAECTFDESYASSLGIDLSSLSFSRPLNADGHLTMNACIDAIWNLAATGEYAIIVLDSIACCPTDQEMAAETGAANIAAKARLLAQELPKLVGILKKNVCSLLILNHVRDKPGVTYGNPEYYPGGSALMHYCAVIVHLRGSARNETDVTVKAKVVKNKVGKPFKTAQFLIEYGSGVDNISALVDRAIDAGILTKKGSFYYRQIKGKEQKLAQGKSGIKEWAATFEEKLRELVIKKETSTG